MLVYGPLKTGNQFFSSKSKNGLSNHFRNPFFENVKNASSDKTSFKKETSYLPTFRYSFNFQPVRPFTISLSPLWPLNGANSVGYSVDPDAKFNVSRPCKSRWRLKSREPRKLFRYFVRAMFGPANAYIGR